MLRALFRTITEILGDKKAAYSFLNMIGACVLHVCYAVTVQEALLLVSPLSFLTFAQALVEASAARAGTSKKSVSPMPMAVPLPSMPES
jgi:hypothetical protein